MLGEATPLARSDQPDPRSPQSQNPEAEPVYDHMVVEPAETHQIRRVGRTALRPRNRVMDLQSVVRRAPFGRALHVASENEATQGWADRSRSTSQVEWTAVLGDPNDFGDRIAQHPLEDLPPHSGAAQHRDTGLTVGFGR